MDTATIELDHKYALGALYHGFDGCVYKYGAVDFGPITPESERRNIHYVWFPWNGKARRKAFCDIHGPVKEKDNGR